MRDRQGWIGVRLPVWAAVLLLAAMIALASVAFTQPAPQPEPPGYKPAHGLGFGTRPAEASWYFTCRGDSRHRHFLRGKTHIWNLKRVIHRGGREYHRGTWKTFDWGREVITAKDSRTYGPC